ncbi:hypothetical protein SEA_WILLIAMBOONE_121 [Gordonia phage WilliamBoone]|nr:hypothetical protein SEA_WILLIAMBOONE_121 [Gordonia phage WilliamBoone]
MFAKFEVHEDSETTEVTGVPAVAKFQDGYFISENLVYRRITVSVWFNSDPDQVHLTYVMTLDAGDEPEIIFHRLITHTPDGAFSSPAWHISGSAIHYLEARARKAPQNGWIKVPADLISDEIRELKERY